jgi:tryptophan synthase beta chain
MSQRYRYLLDELNIPKTWLNLVADLPKGLPPMLHPETHKPIGPEALADLFPSELAKQEFETAPEVAIPEELREMS